MATGNRLLVFHHTEWTADGWQSMADLGQVIAHWEIPNFSHITGHVTARILCTPSPPTLARMYVSQSVWLAQTCLVTLWAGLLCHGLSFFGESLHSSRPQLCFVSTPFDFRPLCLFPNPYLAVVCKQSASCWLHQETYFQPDVHSCLQFVHDKTSKQDTHFFMAHNQGPVAFQLGIIGCIAYVSCQSGVKLLLLSSYHLCIIEQHCV